ncbi:YebC/PmpR family DNA-binding transcriptional regulator [archaeon]|nr:MAG: YebC/PmpR family DNA-binding transcriptional regulator [archaeon]
MRCMCSKWAKIQRQKGANDAARSILFSKMSAAIGAAAKAGGPDLASNLRLQGAVERAKSLNVPKDVIERAIASGSNMTGMEDITFEAMGPKGLAVLVETLTNNKKKTTINVKYVLKQKGFELGSSGSASFLFQTRGRITIPCTSEAEEEAVMEAASTVDGAEDVEWVEEDGVAYVWCDGSTAHSVRKGLEAAGMKPTCTETLRFPTSPVELDDEEQEDAFGNFISTLEDLEDVQAVWHNAA